MIFLPKCRPFYVVLEKGHGAWKKGMALEKRGMARRHAKTGLGKHYVPLKLTPHLFTVLCLFYYSSKTLILLVFTSLPIFSLSHLLSVTNRSQPVV